MKYGKIYGILLGVTLLGLTSCGSDPNNNVKSTNVDSTNIHGTAPAQYGADNPADTSGMMDPYDDTGRRANTEQQSQ